MRGMKTRHSIVCSALLVVAALGGCATGGPTYSWYHPQGGEYLFAYDRDDCQAHPQAASSQVSAPQFATDALDAPEGPFFDCMHQRGYYLVDSAGEILAAPTSQALVLGGQVGQQ